MTNKAAAWLLWILAVGIGLTPIAYMAITNPHLYYQFEVPSWKQNIYCLCLVIPYPLNKLAAYIYCLRSGK